MKSDEVQLEVVGAKARTKTVAKPMFIFVGFTLRFCVTFCESLGPASASDFLYPAKICLQVKRVQKQ